MKAVHSIRTAEALRAVSDPLRLRILRRMALDPITTKQVADEFGEKPTRLYHHVNALEEAGLIELVETRQNRGTTEKYYRAIASRFVVDNRLLDLSPVDDPNFGALQGLLVDALELGAKLARERFAGSEADGEAVSSVAGTLTVRTTAARADALAQQFRTLLQAARDARTESGDSEFGLTVAFFPADLRKDV